MPTAPARTCTCGGIITNGTCTRCNRGHRNKADRGRGHAAARGYDYQWQRWRRWFLSRHPLCEDCMAQGTVTAAREVHHKMKLKDRPELRTDEGNCMALCQACHSKRTARGE